ncbi:diguanylate cyclase (GGDEF) domain-containing protein [Idiomarina sp. A28L]|uniref:putative bifunctional diguanylate cyclase/phosphodiesterase n=1 Tax=Idiomarina sp. A28L TaxID=1036674 RepID=UPI0002138C2A|nr:bifunctional diguanylate cyclase/phosphodiesterase [Idiomarina sp. A28L]EGN75428.1 diguanylate cyclase (GGDEF) domain-containing protein [Idiomarina sp. A28L]
MAPWQSTALRTAIYIIFGILWILYSDRFLAGIITDSETLTQLQTYKGWAFILVTGFLLYFLMFSGIRRERSLSERDSLTQLLNRHMFQQDLNSEITLAKQENRMLGLISLNLDEFRKVNHSAGQQAGDQLLKDIATAMRKYFREKRCIFGRVAGDEFTILVTDIKDCNEAITLTQGFQKKIRQLKIQGLDALSVSACAGIAIYPNDADNTRDLTNAANIALEEAKNLGAGNLRVYDHFFGENMHSRLQLTADLRQALETDSLSIAYQPQFDANSLEITGVEALLRWHHPEHGPISPDTFIPLAEQQGLIGNITDFVCRKALAELTDANLLGKEVPRLSINVSAHDFEDENSIDRFRSRFEFVEDWSLLQLELTETAAINNFENTLAVLSSLQKAKINISIDDFGTGYSSLSILRKLPIDEVKIDRSFIRDIPTNEDDRTIVRTILAMAHSLQLRVVGEGVECQAQAEFLQKYGCHELQGYLLAQPMPMKSLVEFCSSKQTHLKSILEASSHATN